MSDKETMGEVMRSPSASVPAAAEDVAGEEEEGTAVSISAGVAFAEATGAVVGSGLDPREHPKPGINSSATVAIRPQETRARTTGTALPARIARGPSGIVVRRIVALLLLRVTFLRVTFLR
jgi:hypothetical protein